MSFESDSDDPPFLSAETFIALQEFYKEQNAKQLAVEVDEGLIEENWQLSQFWYNETTVRKLVEIVTNKVTRNAKIALISCPTLYKKLKEIFKVTLFEYDQRFAKLCGEDFVYYDYKSPLDIPKQFHQDFDLVIADPPFLSEECLRKTASTIKFLSKKDIIVCTGATMLDLVNELLGLEKQNFKPQHENNLANDFCCYSTFNVDELITSI